ncbi:MAG: phenylpyruvate tautomerase MIF-related protein [Muribaculaceae bacterium]|nr:phenylpyruvate tautomerase MIF-related protein [Roseburia sp.]MCM1431665.1 phenylpyruvate tautomerase MIF-related protein [Muribaculaceae bacterium]MCM1491663.1 phenylpyruvate tautomerase MIF-related protein [Muribaculaceae bacterium]
MPFINSKISTPLSKVQETAIKEQLGKAIELIPGKSESWLMVGFEPESSLYFRGDNSQPIAFVEVSVYGAENPDAFSSLTGKICDIYAEVLGIARDHIYVKYQAVDNWGWNGSNF